MSHYCVIVVGTQISDDKTEELIQALHPFCEHSEDVRNDPRFEFVDTTDDLLKDHATYTLNDKGQLTLSAERIQTSQEYYQKLAQKNLLDTLSNFNSFWEGCEEINGRFGRYRNPNAKWDWWAVGGRWDGFFDSVDGTVVNSLPLRQWNVEPKYIKNYAHALTIWDLAHNVIDQFELDNFLPWNHFVAKLRDKTLSHQEARDLYGQQPLVRAWRSQVNPTELEREVFVWGSIEEFLKGREEYAEDYACGTITSYAFVHEGVWYEKGKMGWFGCASDEKDDATWREQFITLIASLPSDAVLTLVDCHI